MARDLDPFRRRSEELVRRNLGSRASRDHARRRVQRGVRSVFIRVRRAILTFLITLAALIGYTIAAGTFGIMAVIGALFMSMLLAFLMLFLPVRDRRAARPPVIDGGAAVRLDQLATGTEDYLLERSRQLPHQAGPTLDRIIDRLRDLEPSLASVPHDAPIGGEAQRLIGQHLPGLIDNYLGLPPSERHFRGENSDRLAESLGIVADELDDLCQRIGEERRTGFETERRFLEARYRDSDNMRLDGPA